MASILGAPKRFPHTLSWGVSARNLIRGPNIRRTVKLKDIYQLYRGIPVAGRVYTVVVVEPLIEVL